MKRIAKHYNSQLSLALMAPLLILTLVTNAETVGMVSFMSGSLTRLLLNICHYLFPGIFAVLAALLIPTRDRLMQLSCVAVTFALLTAFEIFFLKSLFMYPTAAVLAALSSALPLLPASTLTVSDQAYRSRLWYLPIALLLPFAVLTIEVVVVRQLNDFISLTFVTGVLRTAYACLIAPCFLVAQTFGFNAGLNGYEAFMNYGPELKAVANTVALTNTVSLPVLLLTLSVITNRPYRLFMFCLGFICLLCAPIGACISIVLCILLLFFPGSFFALLMTAVFLYFLVLHGAPVPLADFYTLYQPNLHLRGVNLMFLPRTQICCSICAVIIPILLLITDRIMRERKRIRLTARLKTTAAGFRVNRSSNPDLCVLALIRAIGGLDNLEKVNAQGRELLIYVRHQEQVAKSLLSYLCLRRPSYLKHRRCYVCNLGDNCQEILKRLNLMLADNGNPMSPNQIPPDLFLSSVNLNIRN